MPELCNVDGRIVPLAEATVPIMDRGFLFGDSVYEVLRTYDGVPFAWPEHLERLRASAAGLRLPVPIGDDELVRRIRTTLAMARAGAAGELYVRVIVTRGLGATPSIDLAQATGPARCLVLVRPLPPLPAAPAELVIVDRLRIDRRALDPALKTGNYLNSVLALAEAKARGADDGIMLNAAGHVTEASTSNVFLVAEGTVRTPSLATGILAGVTRAQVLDLCRDQGIPVCESDLTAADLRAADEMFLSSTLREVWPVRSLDGRTVGYGAAVTAAGGPLTARIAAGLRARIASVMASNYAPRWHDLATADRAR